MNAFDKVIGYDTIKKELQQLCDMICNPELYKEMGARIPRGILLYGAPGLGKSLLARSFIEESGLPCFTVRRNRKSDDFVEMISCAFAAAKNESASILFFDDLDKFANEDERHRDAEEYVAVQSGIDEIGEASVFVLATVNEKWKLPDSLIRPGRFDRQIKVKRPSEEDARRIIKYYLSNKRVADDVNMEDITKMMSYSSCAELEMIINEAAVNAAFSRKTCIGMRELVQAVLRVEYDAPDYSSTMATDKLRKIAFHEAGHLVVSEVLTAGSVGLSSIRRTGRGSVGGFTHTCKTPEDHSVMAMVSLAGKAAAELYFGSDDGCTEDINKAFNIIRGLIAEVGTRGFGMIDVSTRRFQEASESMNSRNEAVAQAEMEALMTRVREILIKNREFLEKAAEQLIEKDTLLYSDIQALREKHCAA